MDLRRERKRSLKLREMEQAQEEDRKARQKSTNEMAEEKRLKRGITFVDYYA